MDDLTGASTTQGLPPVRERGLEVGARAGRYVIVDLLGQGGGGVVYSAYDPELRRPVALKLAWPRPGRDGRDEGQLLLREAQAMARLNHPHVCAVYDVGTVGDAVFIAMELVEGGALSTWLRHRSPSVQEVVRLFLEAAEGLQAAHDAGLVHRDFKPENVLVGSDGRVRVADFGLVHGRGPEGAGGEDELAGAGTPLYMAPEQHAASVPDARADQYAFAVALLFCACRTPPFRTGGLGELLHDKLEVRLAVQPRAHGVPAYVEAALRRALSPDPAARFADMRTLAAALRRDPARRVGAWAAGAIVAVALGATVAFGIHTRSAEAAGCERAGRPDGIPWSDAKEAALTRSLVARGASPALAGHAARALGSYRHAWSASMTESCLATRVRHAQSDEAHGLRAACLEGARRELDEVERVLEGGDGAALQRAPTLVAELPPLARCNDVSALLATADAHVPPSLRPTLDAVADRLAAARVAQRAGHIEESREALEALFRDVTTVPHAPTRAAVEAELADGLGRAGREREGLVHAAAAYRAAMEAHDYGTAVSALRIATFLVVARQRDRDRAGAWGEMLLAALALVPRRDDLRTRASAHAAAAFSLAGEHERALGLAREALASSREVFGADSVPTQEALASLVTILKSAGRLEEALGYAREEYTLARATFGDAHPEVATSCLNIGSLEGELGRAEEAITWTSRALRLFESSLPPDHPLWTTTASNLASDLSELGRCDEAVPLAERALRARRAHDGADAPRAAYPLLALAECAVARGDTPATLALTAQIRALAATLPKRVTADAWMLEAKALRLDRRRAPEAARAAREAQTLFEGEGLLAEAKIAEALLTTQRTGASPP